MVPSIPFHVKLKKKKKKSFQKPKRSYLNLVVKKKYLLKKYIYPAFLVITWFS